MSLDFGQAVCGTVAATGQSIYIPHVQSTTGVRESLIRAAGIRAYASEPLQAGGQLLGTLSFGSRSRDRFDREDLLFFQAISRHVALARERLQVEAERAAGATRLREQEAFLRSVLDASADCIKVIELGGSLSYMNINGQCAMEIDDFGAVAGAQWTALWPAESAGLVRQSVEQARAGRNSRFEAFCPTAKGTPRWWDVSVAPILNLNGEPARIVSVSRDITQRWLGEERLKDSEAVAARRLAELETLYNGAPVGMALVDTDLRFVRINEAMAEINGLSVEDHLGRTLREVVPRLAAEMEPNYRQVLETGVAVRSIELEGETPAQPGVRRHWIASFDAVRSPAGEVIGINSVVREVTKRKQAEQQLALMNAELHHRVKNMLATVQGIAHATLRTSADLATFGRDFSARLSALANTHSLLVAGRGVSDLREMFCAEVRPYDVADGPRLFLAGPEVSVPASVAVPLGMALHELTTNAVKHGALSAPAGVVTAGWTVTDAAGERNLRIDWRESGGPPVHQPQVEGFGSKLLRRVFSNMPDARVERQFEPAGLHVHLDLPLPLP
jgi:PAS domain S-box-containing protein